MPWDGHWPPGNAQHPPPFITTSLLPYFPKFPPHGCRVGGTPIPHIYNGKEPLMVQSFEATLVRQCALTLAGMKPGSLFCLTHPDLSVIRTQAAEWNTRLHPLGLRVKVLLERPANRSALIYVYRPHQLRRLLSLPESQSFLSRMGYRSGDTDLLLEQLGRRLWAQEDFPHEIGIFLGYPLRDVIGFIEHRGQNFTCCGLWKSYGNPEAMKKCFACYRTCINSYIQRYEQGTPIEALAVPA